MIGVCLNTGMITADNLYSLDYLYPRILILELIEKTKGCAVVWDRLRPSVYKTHWQVDNRYYNVTLTYLKTTYRIDFIRNGRSIYNVDSFAVAELSELYQIVEIYLAQVDESLMAIQNQLDCTRISRLRSYGGVVGGGTSIFSKLKNPAIATGGVKVGGLSVSRSFIPARGGVVVGGTTTSLKLINAGISGGVRVGGKATLLSPLTSSGGIVVGGTSVAKNYITAHGGVLCKGSSVSKVLLKGRGGVVVRGEAKVTPYNIISRGGARARGIAEVPIDLYLRGSSTTVTGIKKLLVNGGLVDINTLTDISAMAVDVKNNKIFWSLYVSSGLWRLYSANLNGTGVVQIAESELSITNIAVDGTQVYYAHPHVFFPSAFNAKIYRCNYDGSSNAVFHYFGEGTLLGLGWKNGFLYYSFRDVIGSYARSINTSTSAYFEYNTQYDGYPSCFYTGYGGITAIVNKDHPNNIDFVINAPHGIIQRTNKSVTNYYRFIPSLVYQSQSLSSCGTDIYVNTIDGYYTGLGVIKFNLDDITDDTVIARRVTITGTGYQQVSTGIL